MSDTGVDELNFRLLEEKIKELYEVVESAEPTDKHLQQMRDLVRAMSRLVPEVDRQIKDQDILLREKEFTVQQLTRQLQGICNSRTWRLGQSLIEKIDGTIVARIAERLYDKWGEGRAAQPSQSASASDGGLASLHEMMREHAHAKGVIIQPPTVDWNIPLYQRHQHMAIQMARRGYLFFYCANNIQYGETESFEKIEDRCFVTDRYPVLIKNLSGFVLNLYSTCPHVTARDLAALKKQNFVVYQYIDHIHEDITGKAASFQLRRHRSVSPHLILASAFNLYEETVSVFGRDKVLYLPNAADYEHFHIARVDRELPTDLRPIVSRKKPVIGYYGALAKWIDYDLLNRLSVSRPDYEIVLVGVDYDASMKSLERRENVHYLGVKPYALIPKYGAWFDVAVIPFVEGDIADATSPLKLFEYMALGKPIVTTYMRECRRYKSVLSGSGVEQFISSIDDALRLRYDTDYLEILDREARENTWQARAEAFDSALQERKP